MRDRVLRLDVACSFSPVVHAAINMSAQTGAVRAVPAKAGLPTLTASKYRAFISYSHRDEKWAAWLHSALEIYRIPKSLVGQMTAVGDVPSRLAPVFRDREELPTATDLGNILTQALRDSAFQIVICSPAAARSRWVNEEVLTFKRLGRAERVLCLIVGGEPYSGGEDESFPAAVRFNLGTDGALSSEPAEPIAADVRPGKDGKANALLKIVAGMLGVGLDVLKQREHARRQRRLVLIAGAAVAGMTVTSVLAATAWFARLEAEAQRVRAEAEAETARQTTSFMVDLFRVSDPSESLGNSITAREILDKGAARIELELADQPDIQATLMDTMGTVYTSLGLYTPAVSLIERALTTRTTRLGGEQLEVADSLNHLGEVLTLNADYTVAEQRLSAALEIRRRELAAPDPLIAKTLADLGDVLTLQGKYPEATPFVEEALTMRRELYGDANHADLAESIEDLGFNRYYLGDYANAVEDMRAALAMRRAVHGGVHPDLAEAINNVALLLYETGDHAAAGALYREALDMVRVLHGPQHENIATALINYGQVLHDQGDYDSAEANFEEALAMQRTLLGEQHPDLVGTMNNLAFLYYDEGRIPEAIATLRSALSLARTALGEGHPDVGAIATNLGFWLTQEGENDEALMLLDRALEIRRAAFGENHPQVASTLSIKANLLLATMDFAGARDTARQARMILSESLSPDHWRVATAASAEGAALTELGEYAEAETLLVRSKEILSQGGAAMELLSRQSAERLAHLYSIWRKQ
jgi:tetratricopeptide (TPR) repeat protein